MSFKSQVHVSEVVSLASQILDEMGVNYKVLATAHTEYGATIHVNAREVDAVKMEIYKRLPQIYLYEVRGDLKDSEEII